MSEREKMLAGEPYDAFDPELATARQRAQATLIEFNGEADADRRAGLMAGLLGSIGAKSVIVPPFFCDYGANVQIGVDCFVNTNAVFLDGALITLGDRVQLGPGVQLLTADHPREPELRAQDIEFARPVAIGENCWIGAGAILCPGVNVGEGSIIGAGSVVTREIPARTLAVGNPCRVVREL